jgi:hypothetical protein
MCKLTDKEKATATLARRHRNALHVLTLGIVVAMIGAEGWHRNDLAFLALSLLTEVLP